MLGAEILATNFIPGYEAVSTDCTHCTVEQEMDSHMCHMSTYWSADLVSCQFHADLRTENIHIMGGGEYCRFVNFFVRKSVESRFMLIQGSKLVESMFSQNPTQPPNPPPHMESKLK